MKNTFSLFNLNMIITQIKIEQQSIIEKFLTKESQIIHQKDIPAVLILVMSGNR